MPHYLQQIAYSIEGWKALVKKPQDRIEAVRPAIEIWWKDRERLVHFWGLRYCANHSNAH